MPDLEADIWNQQIGSNRLVGYDFSGREIHRGDFRNPNSPYGWTLLALGEQETFLVVHNQTMAEFPDQIQGEFYVNGKIFEIGTVLGQPNQLDINEITYESTASSGSRPSKVTEASEAPLNSPATFFPPTEPNQDHLLLDQTLKAQAEELQTLKAQQHAQELQIQQQQHQISALEQTTTWTLSELENQTSAAPTPAASPQSFGMTPLPNPSAAIPSMALAQWDAHFGAQTQARDFANKVLIKSEFGKNGPGGWGLDHYTDNPDDGSYISSLAALVQRQGRRRFKVDDHEYEVRNQAGQFVIVSLPTRSYTLDSATQVAHQIASLKPDQVKDFCGTYESYASVLINLNHFPVDYLDKFGLFLKQMLHDQPLYKEHFIYLNKRAYERGHSNITSYARVYFKYGATRDEVQILLVTLTFKAALIQFINNYRAKNNRFVVSFSMVLSNHRSEFKFIQAQTNYDILRRHPVPFKLPLYKLVLDQEFNMLLQYHENELWKKLRPFALDQTGQKYYICDLNPDDYVGKL